MCTGCDREILVLEPDPQKIEDLVPKLGDMGICEIHNERVI